MSGHILLYSEKKKVNFNCILSPQDKFSALVTIEASTRREARKLSVLQDTRHTEMGLIFRWALDPWTSAEMQVSSPESLLAGVHSPSYLRFVARSRVWL